MPVFISIITVCRNEKERIAATCDSVIRQSYKEYEWIIIDGGSTDGTFDVLCAYRDRIAILISEQDGGVYQAMNKGIRLAKGDYLIFLNGGDAFCDTHSLEKLASSIMSAMPVSPDIVYGESVIAGTHDPVFSLKGKKIDLVFFSGIVSLHHQSCLIKAGLFAQYGLYDESYKIAGDYEWWLRYFAANRTPHILYIDDRISFFDSSGISSKRSQRLVILSEVLRAFKTHLRLKEVLVSFFSIHVNYIICTCKAHVVNTLERLRLDKQGIRLYRKCRSYLSPRRGI